MHIHVPDATMYIDYVSLLGTHYMYMYVVTQSYLLLHASIAFTPYSGMWSSPGKIAGVERE